MPDTREQGVLRLLRRFFDMNKMVWNVRLRAPYTLGFICSAARRHRGIVSGGIDPSLNFFAIA